MGDPIGDQMQLLRDARASAEKLLAGLTARRDDLDRHAGQLAPVTLTSGQQAFARAIDAARRTADGIDRARRTDATTPH